VFAITIIYAILSFGLIIFAHEVGHYLSARLCGVKVNEFAVGMGPRLVSKTVGETRYSLRAIPIGGFTAMEGEDDDSEDDRAFNKKPIWKRLIVLLAGSLMNFVTGLVIFLIIFASYDVLPTRVIGAFTEDITTDSHQQVKIDDEILKIGGERVYIAADIELLADRFNGQAVDIVVRRDGKKLTLTGVLLDVAQRPYNGQTYNTSGLIPYAKKATLFVKIDYAFRESVDMLRLVRMGLFDLIGGKAEVTDMAGPVGVTSMLSEAGKQSAETFWFFVAAIAINIGFMNLLPLPALDGGRIIFLVIELVRRKPFNPKYEGYVHTAGLAALLAFSAFVMFNDIKRLIIGG